MSVTEGTEKPGTALRRSTRMDQQLESEVYQRALLIGVVAGMRSMLPLALLNWTRERDEQVTTQPDRFLNSPGARALTALAATGEMIGDKLPVIPSRLSGGPFFGRLAIGGFAGMTLCRRYGVSPLQGALLGTLGAGLGSFGGYLARIWLSHFIGTPDAVGAVLEDATAFSLGYFAVKK